MTQRILLLGVLLTPLLIFIPYVMGQNPSPEEFLSENINVSQQDLGLSFVPPEEWLRVPVESDSSIVYASSKVREANILIGAKESSPFFYKIILQTIRNKRMKMGREKKIIFEGVPCYVFTYYGKNQLDATKKTKVKEYMFFKGNMFYQIVFSADVESFDDYWPDFQDTLNSFQIVN